VNATAPWRLVAATLLLVTACGPSIHLSFVVNRPPTLLSSGSVDLQASGGVRSHVIDEGGICGAIDPAKESDAGQTASQTFTLPRGSSRAFVLSLPVQLGEDYVTLIAVVRPFTGRGSAAVSADGPGYVYVGSATASAGGFAAAGDLVGLAGSITVDRKGRAGTIDATLQRVTAQPTATGARPSSSPAPSSGASSPSPSTSPSSSPAASPSASPTVLSFVRHASASDVHLTGTFRCAAGLGQGT
jgi:hypothetical protein